MEAVSPVKAVLEQRNQSEVVKPLYHRRISQLNSFDSEGRALYFLTFFNYRSKPIKFDHCKIISRIQY